MAQYEYQVGDLVKIISSTTDYIPDIAEMIGKTYIINEVEDQDCIRINTHWYFGHDELELVER